jgi:TPR repeat protein
VFFLAFIGYSVEFYSMSSKTGVNLIFLLLISLGIPAVAKEPQTLDEAFNILAQEGYSRSAMLSTAKFFRENKELIQKMAIKGDPMAQVVHGILYIENGGSESFPLAIGWFQKAADQKNAYGQFVVGSAHFHGECFPQDYSKGFEWFMKSAKQGYHTAQRQIALCYVEGKGVPQSYKKAFPWFEKAAVGGNIDAQARLGMAYLKGYGTAANPPKGYKWLKIAASQGHQMAIELVDGIQKALDEKQLKEPNEGVEKIPEELRHQDALGITKTVHVNWRNGQPLVREFHVYLPKYVYQSDKPKILKDAKANNPIAQFNLQYLISDYLTGPPFGKPDIELLEWIKGKRNEENPLTWLARSADKGFAPAQNNFAGRLYGIAKNELGYKLLLRAADKGDALAQFNLGLACARGQGTERSLENAVNWFIKSAENGYFDSEYWLACFFNPKKQTLQNYASDRRWLHLLDKNTAKREIKKLKSKVSAKNLSDGETNEAENLARDWWQQNEAECKQYMKTRS